MIERLSLFPVELPLRQNIEIAGGKIRFLTFVETGMASATALFEDGSEVEVGTYGYQSVVGISALMGSLQSLNRVYTQIAGRGYRCSVARASVEFEKGGSFRDLLLRCVQAQLLQSMQSTGCNLKHTVEQRLSRWLLLCMDRTGDTEFLLPQAFLADMLGSRRTTITIAAGVLKQAGVIRYTRGRVEIVDVRELKSRACECYRVVNDHLHSALAFAGNTEG